MNEYPDDSDRSGADADPVDTAVETAETFPWPPQPGESVITAWGRTWQGSALRPTRFFASLPAEGSLGAAVLYYLSIGIPVAGAALFWSMVRDAAGWEPATGMFGAAGAWAPLIEFLLSPILLLLSLFAAAGVTHLMLKILGAAGGDYGMTTRVFAYAYSPQLLGAIPWIGVVAGFVWMVVVAIIGLRVAHRTSAGRAAAAVLIPLSLLLMFGIFMALVIAAGGLLELPA